jgi:phosphoglycolate phosphatase
MSVAPAVLFDLDGTLTDSRLGILRCTRYAFERLSETTGRPYPLPPDEDLRWIVGPPLRDSFGKLAGAENAEILMGFYLERYVSIGAFENHVYDGIPEALGALRLSGARLYVATSKNESDARRILEHFALAGLFRGIHGAKADGGRADKSELLAYVLKLEGLAAGRDPVAMIGDRKFDAIGARRVGIAAIGALWGYGGAEELKAAGANLLVETPRGVPVAVAEVFARRTLPSL